jgi:hypothetical protein
MELLDVSGQRMYASEVDLVGSRASLAEFGFGDGGMRRNDSGHGDGSSDGGGSKDREVEHEIAVEGKKKGWKGSLRKRAVRMFCCIGEAGV